MVFLQNLPKFSPVYYLRQGIVGRYFLYITFAFVSMYGFPQRVLFLIFTWLCSTTTLQRP